MLKTLIDKLENIECKLFEVKNKHLLGENVVPQVLYKSLTNTVNILNSLVNKTIQNKNSNDDITFSLGRSCISGDEHMYPCFSRADEFMIEVKNIHLDNSELPTRLIKFLNLLGDLLFSICEIGNVKTKIDSGITVGEIVMVKKQYLTLWEIMKSQDYPIQEIVNKSQGKQEDHPSKANLVSEVVDAMELCLKEMSKVKLAVEHCVKRNLIELQFNKPEEEFEMEKNVKQDKHSSNGKSLTFLQEFLQKQPTHLNQSEPSSGPQGHYFRSGLLCQNYKEWDKFNDYSFVQDPHINIFNPPFMYSPDVLFFEPPTVVLKPQVEPTIKNSLPKIYSVESVNENAKCISYDSSLEDNGDTDAISSENMNLIKENESKKHLFENLDEDLFTENLVSKVNREEYTKLKEKICSLIAMLKTENLNDMEDIFKMTPEKVKHKETLNVDQLNERKEQITTSNTVKKGKICKSNIRKLEIENGKTPKTTNSKIKNIGEKNHTKYKERGLEKQPKIQMENTTNFGSTGENEVIYDEQSVIELFKQNRYTIDDSVKTQTQSNNVGLWPVVANYIYVSKGEKSKDCNSVSSDTSSLLNKNFEKSFYSLQMNKKYEQKRLYDGDIIVLNHTRTLQKEKILNASSCNQFAVGREEKISEHMYLNRCAVMADSVNQNKFLKNLLVPADGRGRAAQQQTYAVHYADCADSFVVTKNYKKEKLNFLNFDGYNSSQNWENCLSIFTKFGTNTRINQTRILGKILRNISSESLHKHNLFGNVQTLTSSGGPFRLFDINGYPLTDSEGNVLCDPYGKCVVQLDATGFPKDDTQVFDAAGFSPKDIKFDPTRKPNTNCIIVELTDSFKRPLHLFDKYGRPLTDCSGKLLVNIHGRPLLRFDSFGRPTTDYRGGPLYTENGFRWSLEEQSQSKEFIDETLTSQGVNLLNGAENTPDCKDTMNEKNSPDCTRTGQNNFTPINLIKSDMWLQVENVLQKYSHKTKSEEKTLKPNEVIGDYLSPIIYHHNGIKKFTQYNGTDNQCKKESELEEVDHKVEHCNKNLGYVFPQEAKINYGQNKGSVTGDLNTSQHFLQNIKVMTDISKYFNNNNFQKELNYLRPNFFIGENDKGKLKVTAKNNILKKNQKMCLSLCGTSNNNRVVTTNFDNNEYVNNLCSEILKSKLESKILLMGTSSKTPQASTGHNENKDNFTDAPLSDFTSSFVSKYTNEIPLYTDTPANSLGYQNRDSEKFKLLKDVKKSKVEKKSIKKGIEMKGGDLIGHSGGQITSEKSKINKSTIQKVNKNLRNEAPKKHLQSSGTSTETNTYIHVINKNNNKYQINVRERLRTGYQSCKNKEFAILNNNCIMDDSYFPERDIINKAEKEDIAQPVKHPTGVYHGEYCRHFNKQCTNKNDSPFRFPSEEETNALIGSNNKLEFVQENSWLDQDKIKQYERGYFKQAATKPQPLYPTIVKKPQRNNRDCNLVSFLGTPVKYVLNKLDTKLTSRHRNQRYQNTMYYPNKKYYGNDKTVKTLYYSSKDNNKFTTSTETQVESKGVKKYVRKGDKLDTFKSTSYSGIQESTVLNMSYSGSQDTSGKFSPESKTYNKCLSDTVVSTGRRNSVIKQKKRRYEGLKQKMEQYSFETHYVPAHTTNESQPRQRSERIQRGLIKRKSKSPKIKPAKLFNKTGISGSRPKKAW